MAISISSAGTAAMACMPKYRDIVPHYSLLKDSNVKFVIRKSSCRRFIVKSSGDDTAATTTTETWEGGEISGDDTVEVAKGPPSIISTLNVEKALRGIAITDVDHYANLGLPRGCTYEQVGIAYQNKVKELSNQGLDEDDFNKEIELIKESYRILSTEEERRLYDWSLARSAAPDKYVWPFEVDITQAPVDGTPPIQEPEDVGPTSAVGYFLLAWFVLACILSIYLNV